MALRSKLLAWSIALPVTVFLLAGPVHADPMTDSFVGKPSGSHRPAKRWPKKRLKKPGSGAKPSSRPATKTTARPTKPASEPAAADDEFTDSSDAPATKEAPPAREPAEDRPRAKRSADADEADESSSDETAEADDRPEEKPKAKKVPPSRKPSPKKVIVKKPVKKSDEDEEESEEEDEDEEEEDEGSAFTSLPIIAPHMVSLGLGGAIMGRNFQFGAPAQLQKESSFPRVGFVLSLETFPFLAPSDEWWRRFGLGIFYASEPLGQASIANPSTGASVNTPVKQTRWGADVRYVIPLGDHVVLTPGVGLMSSSFALSTKMPVAPSACPATSTMACLPDTNVTMLAGTGSLRVALAPEIGLSLGGMYLVGLMVKNKPQNQIGYESATSSGGFQVEAALSYLVTDWFTLRGAFPITSLNYTFHTASVAYKSASETYYGLMAQAVFSLH